MKTEYSTEWAVFTFTLCLASKIPNPKNRDRSNRYIHSLLEITTFVRMFTKDKVYIWVSTKLNTSGYSKSEIMILWLLLF